MRTLSEHQWERYFELLEQLEKLPDEHGRDALLAQRAEGASDLFSGRVFARSLAKEVIPQAQPLKFASAVYLLACHHADDKTTKGK